MAQFIKDAEEPCFIFYNTVRLQNRKKVPKKFEGQQNPFIHLPQYCLRTVSLIAAPEPFGEYTSPEKYVSTLFRGF